jgi:Bacterial Ig domain
MKTWLNVLRPQRGSCYWILLTLVLAGPSLAQTNYEIPTVTIGVTDTNAIWAGDPGIFTLFRHGPTNAALNVFYRIGGTAANGVDYVQIPNLTMIPAGISSADIVITPKGPGQAAVKSVELTLAYPPTMPPINYLIGYPSNGVLFIRPVTVTNLPPTVAIVIPTNNAVFPAGADVAICADARDDGYVSTVEFFAGDHSLGVRTNNPMSAGPMNPFCLVWSNVAPGNFVLTAKATDNTGLSTISPPVNISVGPPPPPTNYPPVVRIIAPPNGTIFLGPVDIPLFAYAVDRDDPVASVEFFSGTNSLGFGQPVPVSVATPWPSSIHPTNQYVLVWSNAPVGAWLLTALATDSRGASARSEVVKVTILPPPPPPPPTNCPVVVSIQAVVSKAIEGTNCWTYPSPTNTVPTGWNNVAMAACRPVTICGPRNGLFQVRRTGPTNDSLTVAYAVSGTASNGVDYVFLSGTATIPAGQRAALIPVVPIGDNLPEPHETVILVLLPQTNSPPDYCVGCPSRAAVVIIDSSRPWATPSLLANNMFHLSAGGPDGAWFAVEYSTDLRHWIRLCGGYQVLNGAVDFVDPDTSPGQLRFYRAVPLAGPPVD